MNAQTTPPGQSQTDSSPPSGQSPGKSITLCGDLDIRISRDGTWYYLDSPIMRKEMVCLFSSALARDEQGDYWLVTPTERGRIEVEDAPFLAEELFTWGTGRKQVVSFRTNVDEIISLNAEHPIRMGRHHGTDQEIPYLLVRKRIEARISRAVYYELARLGKKETIEGKDVFGIWSCGEFFSLGSLNETP